MTHLPDISFGLGIAVLELLRNIRTIARAFSTAGICLINESGRIIRKFYSLRKSIKRMQEELRGRARMRAKGHQPFHSRRSTSSLNEGRTGRKQARK